MAKNQNGSPRETLFDVIASSMHSTYASALKSFANWTTRNEPKAEQTLHRLWAEIFAEATDPRNTLLGNPLARQKARETYGLSVVDGLLNFWQDFAYNDGYPALTDLSAFKVGENLAVTPGTVVYRNKMFELIHYAPVTEQVHETPLLIVPPPINKYYILDLAPGRSLVEHAVAAGQSVYMISWVNPTEQYRDVEFVRGYVQDGVMAAMKFIDRPVSLAGLCLGGTLASIAAAADRDGRVQSLSLIVTLTDFGDDVGMMGAMIDQKLVDRVYAHTRKTGTLSAKEMGAGWAWIQAMNLVFNPGRRRWLLGEKAPAMDLLAWNADGTRLPSEMHRQYLQSCYIDNLFAKGELMVDSQIVGIADITVPVYAVVGESDHIVPWRSSLAGISQSSGQRRLVLVPRGHIGTIVSVGSKASYLVGPDCYVPTWETEATEHRGSWWSDWTGWLDEHSGQLVALVSGEPNMGEAPGLYVRDVDPATCVLTSE